MFHACKDHMRLEVSYTAATGLKVTPIPQGSVPIRITQVIAENHNTLAHLHLNGIQGLKTEADVRDYFEERGWRIEPLV